MIFYTCASGIYRELKEIYTYCALRAYPDAKVIVDDYGDLSACWRFLRDPEADYVHVTDIDILILPQKYPHQTYYTAHSHMGASYLRGCRKGRGKLWQGEMARICGGEVGLLPEYYKRTELIRERWAKKLRLNSFREMDEVMLCSILREAGYEIPKKPYHFPDGTPWGLSYRDLHLNDFRNNKYLKWKPNKSKVKALLSDIPASMTDKLSPIWLELLEKARAYSNLPY